MYNRKIFLCFSMAILTGLVFYESGLYTGLAIGAQFYVLIRVLFLVEKIDMDILRAIMAFHRKHQNKKKMN